MQSAFQLAFWNVTKEGRTADGAYAPRVVKPSGERKSNPEGFGGFRFADQNKRATQRVTRLFWCTRWDSNPHVLANTGT